MTIRSVLVFLAVYATVCVWIGYSFASRQYVVLLEPLIQTRIEEKCGGDLLYVHYDSGMKESVGP